MSVSAQVPTMGRIVIYVVEDPMYTSQPEYPAIVITEGECILDEGKVQDILCDIMIFGIIINVFDPIPIRKKVSYSKEKKPDTWHWPEIKSRENLTPGTDRWDVKNFNSSIGMDPSYVPDIRPGEDIPRNMPERFYFDQVFEIMRVDPGLNFKEKHLRDMAECWKVFKERGFVLSMAERTQKS